MIAKILRNRMHECGYDTELWSGNGDCKTILVKAAGDPLIEVRRGEICVRLHGRKNNFVGIISDPAIFDKLTSALENICGMYFRQPHNAGGPVLSEAS
jgi:hypothetical protein